MSKDSISEVAQAAGFAMIEASASYHYFSTDEQLQLVSHIGSNRVKEAEFVERVLTRPDAFLANSHGEVVGRKG